MPEYIVSLSISTNDECPSPEEAARYFSDAVRVGAAGTVTVENQATGESVEVLLRASEDHS